MGGAVFPPCCLTWGQTMVEVMKIMETSCNRSCAHTTTLSALIPPADQCRPTPPPETPRHSQVSLGQLLWGHYSFLLGPGAHKVLFVPSKSLLPQSCVSSIVKSLQSQTLWGFSIALPDPQVGKSVVGPRIFLIVWEFLGYMLCSLWVICSVALWWG